MPALSLALLFVAVYVHQDVAPWDRLSVRNDGLASLLYVANWRFIAVRHSYFELFASPSPVRHMWSLAVEEQFYIVWPLVTLLCLKLARGPVRGNGRLDTPAAVGVNAGRAPNGTAARPL